MTLSEIKTEKAPGPSNVSLELIAVGWEVGIQVMAELCQGFLDGLGMSAGRALCLVIPIFRGRFYFRNCSCYIVKKLLEHGMKEVGRMLEKRHRRKTL